MLNTAENKDQVFVYKKKLRPSEFRDVWIGRVFIWVVMIIALFPIVTIVAASLAKGDSFSQAGRIFPQQITLDNYRKVLTTTDFGIWVRNSLFVCTLTSIIQLLIVVPAAYAFARLRFAGRKNGLMALLILQMFPAMMAIPAILAIAYNIGLMDNLLGLVLLMCGGSAYNIWLLKGYIDGIPKELDEAAFVDGATHFQSFIKVILPLMKSMLVVIFVLQFIGTYSEFILTSALMKDPSTQTVATGMQTFIKNKYATVWTQFAAAATMASLPIVIVFSLLQKFIAQGLTAGAVKG